MRGVTIVVFCFANAHTHTCLGGSDRGWYGAVPLVVSAKAHETATISSREISIETVNLDGI
jgi:hypothetical protein